MDFDQYRHRTEEDNLFKNNNNNNNDNNNIKGIERSMMDGNTILPALYIPTSSVLL